MADIAANTSTTKTMLVGDEYVGSFENLGDTDWIKIQLVAGVTYSFNLGAATSSSGSYFDTILELYDASGTSLLARNDDTGFVLLLNPAIGDQFTGSSYFQYTATTSGTYYLSASSFDGAYTGEYLLSAYVEDIPDTTSTPAQLQLGASMAGQITPEGDRDAYTMTTVVGQYYTVLYGASYSFDNPTSDFNLAYADVVVKDANGAVIATNPVQGLWYTYELTFQATTTTTVFSVGASPSGPDDFGQYILRVNEGSPLDAVVENIRPQPSHLNIYFVGAAEVSGNGTVYEAQGWTAGQIASAMAAFDTYAQVANLTFSLVNNPTQADIFMAVASPLPDGADGLAIPFRTTGTVTIDGVPYAGVEGLGVFDPSAWAAGLQPGSYGFDVMLHEIGHLLGLSHPFDGGFGASALPGVTSNFWDYGDFSLDQVVFTVMSYNPGFKEKDGTLFLQAFGEPAGPMALDVAAVQSIYGANTTTNAGNDTYVLPETNDIGAYYKAIWDTGGVDTIAVAAADTAGATIDLRAASLRFDSIGGGAVSSVNGVEGGFTIAGGAVIENATGAAGNDRLVGNEAANVLVGNGGADRLAGGAGNDSLYGGDGNDVLFGDAMPGEPTGISMGDGQVVKAAGAGNFLFTTAIDLTAEFSFAADPDIANATTIPHVTVTGTGDGHFDIYSLTLAAGTTVTLDVDHTTGGVDSFIEIYTLDGTNFSFLGAQDDNLISGGAAGSNTTLDSFGTFIARTSDTYYIFVENLLDPNFALGVGQNYELNISVSATTEAIGSGAGDDLLDGGTGADRMSGGGGNDRYIIDNSGDVAIETVGGGNADEVLASVSYSAAGQDIERITLTGSAAVNATGQSLDNIITGNSAANRLDGAGGNDWLDGGLGADTMIGGTGNDTFVVDNAHDDVVEASGGGTDEVRSSITYTLGRYVENLTLTGSANINGYGQLLDNHIVGNSGANTLYGDGGNDWLDGGAGADIMIGGDGNDVFIVDNVGDRTVEIIGGGRDEVQSSVSYDLGILLENIEIVALTGAANIDGSGNWLDNVITGNVGANRISGGLGDDRLDGKAGADSLTGGVGRDVFAFSSALGAENVDALTDFRSSQDQIELDNAVFTGLSEGTLTAVAFKDLGQRGAKVDSNDRIIYNSDTGDLYFDADGSGSSFAAILFANVGRHTALSAGDFLIV